MAYDFNDAPPQMGPMGELIPDGSFVKLKMTVRPGGVDGDGPIDKGLLKSSEKSDVKMLDCEFVVVEGHLARRKFWQNFTVAGGKRDAKTGASMGWNISKSVFRAMIESALGLDPKDMSDVAKQKRVMGGLAHLNGISFAARVMVEPATSDQYSDQNRLANVLLVTDPEYAAVMRGEDVQADPVNAKPRKQAGAAAAAAQPGGWQQQSLPSGAPAAAAAAGGAPAPAWLAG